MFEEITREADAKFNLGGKAEILVSAILGLFTNRESGGFRGVFEQFETVGLGDLMNSWIGSGANTPISKEQTESAVGEDALKIMSGETGLDYDTTTEATAFMLPKMVDRLTPNGEMPKEKDLLGMITGYLGGISGAVTGAAGAATAFAGDKFDRVDASVSNTVGGRVDTVGDTAGAVGERTSGAMNSVGDTFDDGGGSPILKWLLPLMILGILIVLGFWFCGKSTPVVINVNTNTNVNTELPIR